MNASQRITRTLLVVTLLIATAIVAQAQSVVYVTANRGTDLNTCSRTSPCRNIQKGVDTVAAGGTVIVLESGDYLPFTVNKSVTVEAAPGITAIVVAASSDGMTVSAANTDTVVVRGLTLNSQGANTGINVTAVGVLDVEGCIVNGFFSYGIKVVLTADGTQVFIKDTIVRNGNNSDGIFLTTTTGTVRASIDGCRVENNFNGIVAFNRSRVTVSNSLASGNSTVGFNVFSFVSGATAEMNLEHCVASNNPSGFVANSGSGGTAVMRVTRSTATNNVNGFTQSGTSTFRSRGDNLVDGNTTADTTGTITIISGH